VTTGTVCYPRALSTDVCYVQGELDGNETLADDIYNSVKQSSGLTQVITQRGFPATNGDVSSAQQSVLSLFGTHGRGRCDSRSGAKIDDCEVFDLVNAVAKSAGHDLDGLLRRCRRDRRHVRVYP